MTDAATLPAADNRVARRNAAVLAVAQACYGITVSIVIGLGGIVGHGLADDKSLATLPITTMMIGTMMGTVPASLFMQRYGRRPGFVLGCLSGIAGAVLSTHAIVTGQFWLFCLATHLLGYYQATAGFYRFAATDTASTAFRPKAIAWALGGGLVGAILTPEIIKPTQDLMVLNAACFLAAGASALVGLLALLVLDIPRPPAPVVGSKGGRPLLEIMLRPRFLAALAAGAVSYGMMNLVMTSTPLAMVACGLTVADATDAIRWHVIAMYLPSFFAGYLISWFGRERMALIGMVLLVACGIVALSGLTVIHFTLAMIALGAGWNLAFVAATAIVADSHTVEERGKVQAANDFVIFGFVALCSFLSGKLMSVIGWEGVNLALFPIVGLAMVLIVLLPRLSGPVTGVKGT